MSKREDLNGLSFDDVFIKPKRMGIAPPEVNLKSELIRGTISDLPVMPSAMSMVFSVRLAKELFKHKIIAPLAREISREKLEEILAAADWKPIVATTSPFREEDVHFLLSHPKVDYVILDSVSIHNDRVFDLLNRLDIKKLRKIIIGHIATFEAAKDFSHYELAAVRVGIGPGSICTTTTVTGVGVPQLQAISEVAEGLKGTGIPILAEGGIRTTGDMAKAIAAGASGIMMGRIFASTTEAGGEIIVVNDVEYKSYEGAEYASVESAEKSSQAHRTEGVSGLVKHIGPAAQLLEQIARCLSTAVAFTGAHDLKTFQEKAEFQRVTTAALGQANHFGIDIITKQNRTLTPKFEEE